MALVFVYIIEEAGLTHAQNTPIEWFLSTPGLGVVLRLLTVLSKLVAYPVIAICETHCALA